jgi:hypothetical protein
VQARPDNTPPGAEEAEWPLEQPEARRRGLPHTLILLGFWGATATMLLLALIAQPDPRGFGTHEQLGLSPCRMMQWTGVPCPGCGVTTSLTLAVQGHPLESLAVQPFGLLTAIALPLLALWALAVHLRGGDLYERLSARRGLALKSALVLMGLAWVYKLAITLG